MANVSSCPSHDDLAALAVGRISEEGLDGLLGHLEGCASCFAKVQTLAPADTLCQGLVAASLRSQGPPEAAVSRLIEKLSSCPAPRAGLTPEPETACVQFAAEIPPVPLSQLLTADNGQALYQALRQKGDDPVDYLAAPQSPDEIGRLANYRVLKVLGQGGMGKVFLAEDVQLRRKVALKVMSGIHAQSVSARQRFLQEAQLAASIEHDHIVPIYQVGEDGGTPFLAMRLLNGSTLEEILSRRPALALEQILRVGKQTAAGLAAAHERNLIHRDIKPANLWVEPTGGGRVKILDFGLARSTTEDASLTQQGTILGTPAYMSPEQARCDKVDHRTDLYSLGCVLYRMATGRPLFSGTDAMKLLLAHALEEATPPSELRPDLPQSLCELIRKLLAKDRDQRPASATEVIQSLESIERALPKSAPSDETHAGLAPVALPVNTTSTPRTATEPEKASPRARRGMLIAIGAVLLALAALAGVVMFLPTGDGKGVIRIEIDDPLIKATVAKNGVTFEGVDKHEIRIEPGKQTLKVKRGDLEFEADSFVLKKGETVRLSVKYLDGKLQVVNRDDGKVLGQKEAPRAVVKDAGWKPTAEQQKFLDAVAHLPAENRIEAVIRKLREANPVYGEYPPVSVSFEPKEWPPVSCKVEGVVAVEVWPLVALPTLEKIDLLGTCVTDFRPLTRLPLAELQIKLILDNLASEDALKAVATLKQINVVPVKDFWAQRADIRNDIGKMAGVADGLPLEDRQKWVRGVMQQLHPKVPKSAFNAISVGKTERGLVQFRGYGLHGGVFDFSPVRALAIEDFHLLGGNLFDATPLAKTKLKLCRLERGSRLNDLSPLAGLPLTDLHLDGTYTNLRPLAGLKLTRLDLCVTPESDLSPLKGMPLESLHCPGAKDLSPLAGAPLKHLVLGNYSPVSDLSPLKGMSLEKLWFDRSRVTDLSPLAGMKLTDFAFWGSPVADLTPLKGMPLTTLDVGRANLDPVLASLPLKQLHVDLRLHSEAEEKVLRSLKLEKINDKSPADFWKEIEKRRKADADKTAATAKVPVEAKALEKALWECGQYPKVKIENGEVVEAAIGGGGPIAATFAPVAAFPKLRRLSLVCGGDYSTLLTLTNLEEFECPPNEVALNRPVLKLLPKLKSINGKPAKEALK